VDTVGNTVYRKCGEVRLYAEICERTDRQTDTVITILRILPG